MDIQEEQKKSGKRWDGSFADPACEADFKASTWSRDCRQIHIMTMPVGAAIAAVIPLNMATLGWMSPLFKIDLTIRLVTFILCALTFCVFHSPPKRRQWLALPFATVLSAIIVILFSAGSGAVEVPIVTSSAIAAALVIWAFVPFNMVCLLAAAAFMTFGYVGVLVVWQPQAHQTLATAPVILLMIHWIGFIYIQNRNTAERESRKKSQDLLSATTDLKLEVETRKQAEERAQTNEAIFRSVFVSSPVPLSLVDCQTGRITHANPRMSKLLGYQPDQLPDRPASVFLADDEAREGFERTLNTSGDDAQSEIRITPKNGPTRWVLVSSNRLVLQGREVILASFVDITDQKDKEIAFGSATQEAEKANFAKSRFLANMSHELRTPLNAIIGFSDIIQSEIFGKMENEKHMDYISDIKDSGIHLLTIINEILDLSKIEAGKEDLYPELIDLNDIIATALRLVQHHVEEKSIEVTTDLDERDFSLVADQRAIKQITLNLLSNAIKFTEPGGQISVRTFAVDAGVVTEISDTGIGIAVDQIDAIIQPFFQVENSLSHTSNGTGLGLPIAKRLAEVNGGSLEIESDVGKGTTVRFFLPFTVGERLVS